MPARASNDPHAAKPAHRRKGDIGPEPGQLLEDALYAQGLFRASPEEVQPEDQDSGKSTSR